MPAPSAPGHGTGTHEPPPGEGGPGTSPAAPVQGRAGGPPPADAAWGWPQSLAGLGVAFAPEVLLYLAAAGMGGGSTTTTRVTAGSAVALVVSSFITYGWQIFGAWLFSLRRAAAGLRAWGFRKPPVAIVWLVPAALVAVYAVSVLHDFVVRPKPQPIVDQFPHTTTGFVLFLLLAVVMAPLFEETFFRGFLFKGFANSWGWVWGAIISAAIFSLAHLQLDVFVPLFALGLALAWLYHRTGSLWSNITLHATFNAISVIAWYFTK